MFGFLIKKAFFDMWDNLFRIILMNLGFLAISAIFFLLLPLLTAIPALFYVGLLVSIGILAVYAGAVSKMTSDIADYKQPGFSDFWGFVKETWLTSLLIAVCIVAYILIIRVAFSFYGSLKSLVGPLVVSLLFWVTVVVVLAGQFFFPIQSRLDRDFRKIVRKSFLILLDNPWFSIAVFFCTLLVVTISAFTAFLIPGVSAVFLFGNTAFKLRLYKYDYLERNPQANRRRIPWDALLVDDRERVGKRTLKGMIFPWKE